MAAKGHSKDSSILGLIKAPIKKRVRRFKRRHKVQIEGVKEIVDAGFSLTPFGQVQTFMQLADGFDKLGSKTKLRKRRHSA